MLRVALVALFWACSLGAQAAITWVGSSTNNSGGSGATSLAINLPAGTAAGDVMIAQVSVVGGSGTTITAPAGWTQIVLDNSGSAVRQGLYYRVASAAEPASYAWSFSSSQRNAIGILTYRGVDTVTPVNASNSSNAGASTSVTAAAVTTTSWNTQIVGFFTVSYGGSSFTPPAGMTERYDAGTFAGPNGVTIEAADVAQAAVGSSGSKTATALNGAANVGQLVALKAAAIMLADYRFDECAYTGVGNEVIDSVGPYDAQARNTLNTSSPGQIQRFGNFNTYSTWAQPSTSLPLTNTDWSLGVWFKMPFPSTHQYHVFASTSAKGDLMFLDRASNYRWGVFTYSPTSTVYGNFQFGTLSSGWHHLVLVGQGGKTSLYVDGAFKETVNAQTNGNVAYLGTSYDYVNTGSAQGFGAPLDEMEFYTNALNATQIATIFNNESTGLNADGTTRAATVCAGGAPGGFNAYDTGTAAGAIVGNIKTKIAGQAFNLDLIVLDTARTAIQTSFAGAVKVELLDASNNSGALDANGCRSTWATIQILGTNPTFAAGDNGRKTVSFQENNAWKDVRVRVSYPAAGAATAVGCSSDNFAIRPASFANAAVSDTDWSTAGTARSLNNTSASGGNVHKAGQPVRVSAVAANGLGNATTNYVDRPAATPIACVLPATCTFGAFTLTTNAVAGVLADNAASYSEVGSFTLQLVDANFAAVDASDGSTTADRYIVSPVFSVGRFVPDHFDLAVNNTPQFKTFNNAACASRSFTYVGQPFGYVTAPQAAVVAKNAAGGTTVNYANNLWKLTATGVTQTYTSVPATPLLTATVGAPTIISNNDGTGFITANGSDTLIYAHTTAAPFPAPFNADIALAMSVEDSAENGASQGIITTSTPATFNGGGAGIAFDAGNAFRYGRLRLSNAHGSERLPLNVPLRAEYFNGTIFVTNAADNCTGFALATDLTLSNYQRNLNPGETTPGPANIVLSSGVSAITLSAPATATSSNSGSVDLTLTVPNWLQFNWSGAVGNPKARATFGVYRNANEFIYLREAY